MDFAELQHSSNEIPPSGQVSGRKRALPSSNAENSTLSTPHEINSHSYMKAVYRCLSIDLQYEIDEADYHNFLAKFKRVNGAFYANPDPLFDAWLLVSDKQRNAFNEDKFRVMYPLIDIEISRVREACHVRKLARENDLFSDEGWVYGGEDGQHQFESDEELFI